jgi:hypothetical protein
MWHTTGSFCMGATLVWPAAQNVSAAPCKQLVLISKSKRNEQYSKGIAKNIVLTQLLHSLIADLFFFKDDFTPYKSFSVKNKIGHEKIAFSTMHSYF